MNFPTCQVSDTSEFQKALDLFRQLPPEVQSAVLHYAFIRVRVCMFHLKNSRVIFAHPSPVGYR